MKPKLQVRLEQQLKDKGQNPGMARGLLQKAGNLDSKGNATAKGKRRGEMTPEERSNDREAKYTGRKPSDFTYDPATNRSRVKKKRG